MSDIPKADQYDTSAIDTHIKEIAKRERSITTGLRLKNLSQIVLWTSLAGFAFALIFILISYGIRLMIYPPPEKEFIERPIPSEVTLKLDETPIPSEITLKLDETSIPSGITLKLDEPLLVEVNNETEDQKTMRNIEKNINSTQQNNIVKNFVAFTEQTVGGYIVTTGWQFSDSNAREPEKEWCYTHSNIDSANRTMTRHNIAEKENKRFTQEPNVDILSQDMGLDISSAMQFINACNWSN